MRGLTITVALREGRLGRKLEGTNEIRKLKIRSRRQKLT
jgi:hypothetical protein